MLLLIPELGIISFLNLILCPKALFYFVRGIKFLVDKNEI
jgi:hypothetical protein